MLNALLYYSVCFSAVALIDSYLKLVAQRRKCKPSALIYRREPRSFLLVFDYEPLCNARISLELESRAEWNGPYTPPLPFLFYQQSHQPKCCHFNSCHATSRTIPPSSSLCSSNTSSGNRSCVSHTAGINLVQSENGLLPDCSLSDAASHSIPVNCQYNMMHIRRCNQSKPNNPSPWGGDE